MSEEWVSKKWFAKTFLPGYAQTDHELRAVRHILQAILYDFARQKPDPHNYISLIFERVSATLDQVSLEDQEQSETLRTALANIRNVASNILSQVDAVIDTQGERR